MALNPERGMAGHLENFMNKLREHPDAAEVVRKMSGGGFAQMKMADKNKLKAVMKHAAPEVAELFNAQKNLGKNIGTGKKFRGKDIRQIAGEAGVQFIERQKPKKEVPLVKKPNANGVERNARGDFIIHGDNLSQIESAFVDGLSKKVTARDFKVPDALGINDTRAYHVGTDQEAFYKPDTGRAKGTGDHMREIVSYDVAKLLGANDLVPPTVMWSPSIDGNAPLEGSAMMSTRVFANKLGMSDAKSA